jgi:hypothetical protein
MGQMIWFCFVFIGSLSYQTGDIDPINPWAENYIEARALAIEHNRPYFILFQKENCSESSKWNTNFDALDVKSVVSRSFIGLLVDIKDFDGQSLKAYYEIEKSPCLLIFSSKGNLLAKYEEVMERNEIISALKEIESAQNESHSASESHQDNDSSTTKLIQAGAFTNAKGAENLQFRLSRICSIKPEIIEEHRKYKVVFDKLSSKEQQELSKKLDTYGYGYIVKNSEAKCGYKKL